MPGLLDMILGYDCNVACDYCTITPAMRTRSLTGRQVVRHLQDGRQRGYDRVSFTGGEPTIRNDLMGLVRAAHKLGYREIKLQSNGLIFAQLANVSRLIAAGVTLFHISIHTHDEAAYERLVQRAGTYQAMVRGLQNVVASGTELVVDVILKQDTYRRFPDAITWLAARGVKRVDLWFVSLSDANRTNYESMPRMTEVMPAVHEGLAAARSAGITVRSLHIPRCLMADDHVHVHDPGAARVMVVTPEAAFELKDSKLTGQRHVPACVECSFEDVCPGIRPDYLDHYGDAEFAQARGSSPTIPARRLPLLA
ncbi:MAG: radical SAM protein [Nannocystaceae bacterium]